MARTKHSIASHKRKKRVLKAAKGQWGDRSKRFRHAKESLLHSMVYAYRDRKMKKRIFRKLWITRINAACREAGLTYNRFMLGLKKAKIELDRKVLSDLAVNHPSAFKELIKVTKEQV
ncbi:MAG: 50S ribosomal protein L20 [Candidatus Omnitrophica bacterium]|nr:50S ribosomal protein L20 [Candidatus Omnitrophota bacterium]